MSEQIITFLLEQLKHYGAHSLLILFVIFAIFYPDKIRELSLWIKTPFFKAFKWFGRSYIEGKISTSVSAFFNTELLNSLDNAYASKIHINVKLVSDAKEVQLKKGALIIRLKEDNDQTKNILKAASLAIPKIVCPLIRSNINANLNKAIDLTVLKKLSDKLGNHARLVYKNEFLTPETQEDEAIQGMIEELVRIDKKGFFISIFANELNYLGEGLFANADQANKTEEVINFLKFLLKIAERSIGEINELSYNSSIFGVSIILLAKSERANYQGITPYLMRLRKNFNSGSESTYIIAYSNAWEFLKIYLNAIKRDKKYNVINEYKHKIGAIFNRETVKIVLVRGNRIFLDSSLTEHLKELNIKEESLIQGTVTDVSTENAVVSFYGLHGFIKRYECSWYSCSSCEEFLKVGAIRDFKIKQIDYALGNIELSLKFQHEDPWTKVSIPTVGEIIEVIPIKYNAESIICMKNNNLEIILPLSEIIWGELQEKDILEIIGQKIMVKVTHIQTAGRLIEASHRQIIPNKWFELQKNLVKGTKRRGNIIALNPQYASVDIGDGIIGRVSKESFLHAGFEYSNYEDNLLIGQILDVTVTKVWVGKEKISLELTRNLKKSEKSLPQNYEIIFKQKSA